MIVRLTPSHIMLACQITSQWVVHNATLHVKRSIGQTSYGFDDHLLGMLGEIALAEARNIFWCGEVGNLRAKDVGIMQVRATTAPRGVLLLHKTDADDDRHFLVVMTDDIADIKGFMWGRAGKVDKYWNDEAQAKAKGFRYAAYHVPQGDLEPVPPELEIAYAARLEARLAQGASNGAANGAWSREPLRAHAGGRP